MVIAWAGRSGGWKTSGLPGLQAWVGGHFAGIIFGVQRHRRLLGPLRIRSVGPGSEDVVA